MTMEKKSRPSEAAIRVGVVAPRSRPEKRAGMGAQVLSWWLSVGWLIAIVGATESGSGTEGTQPTKPVFASPYDIPTGTDCLAVASAMPPWEGGHIADRLDTGHVAE